MTNTRSPRPRSSQPLQTLLFFMLGCISFVDPIIIYKADIGWYFAVLLLFPIAALRTRRWVVSSLSEYACPLGLLVAIALAGIASDHTAKAFIYSTKLAFSLLILWPLLRSNLAHLKWLIRGITALVVANFSLLALHLAAGTPTAFHQPGNRWSTWLSSVGIIGVPAAFVFSYYLMRLIVIKLSLRGVFLTAVGLVLSVASGSRGVIVLCLMTLGAAGLAVFLGRPLSRLRRLAVLLLLTCVFLALVARRQLVTSPVLSGRVASFFDTSDGMDDDGLAARDPLRYRMIQIATEAIRNHPMRGQGLLTLGVPAEGGALQVIHNRYLGAWAELGLLGLVSLAGVVLSWLPDLWSIMRRRWIPTSADDRFHLIWTSLVLAQFLVFGLFFPIGVQISDWVIFLMAKAILRRTVTSHARPQKPMRRPSYGPGSTYDYAGAYLRPGSAIAPIVR